MRKLIFVYIWLLLPSICGARIITVDDDGPADFNNVQVAIDEAVNGDTVEIRPGRYTGLGNRDIVFLGKAITVTGTDPNDPNIVAQTIIDCNASQADQHRGFSFHSGESRDAVLQGLTVTNGYVLSHGGGILCDSGSSPTIRNCNIVGNTIERREEALYVMGGGIYCGDESSPLIENCTIANNSVAGNESWDGGGGGIGEEEGSPVIRKCTIAGNSATGLGGGISFGGYEGAFIEDCVISNNNSTDKGGGLACASLGWSNPAIVSRCIITGNAAANGGGIRCDDDHTSFKDCLIAGNTATGDGGGIAMQKGWTSFTNCTIAGNSATSGGGVDHFWGVLHLYNCILWGNTAPEGPQLTLRACGAEIPTNLIAEYNNIQGGLEEAHLVACGRLFDRYEDFGNIDVDPSFVDPGSMDFRLRADSWCIDEGSNDYANDTDILGNLRIMDGDFDSNAIVDLGAYEVVPGEKPVTVFSVPELHLYADENDPEPEPTTAAISNRGPGVLNWTLSTDCAWLSFVPAEGATTTEADEVAFSVNTDGLTPGTYDCNLVITAPLAAISRKLVPVRLRILNDQIRVPEQFGTIQEGIDHASEGGVVIVADGVYTGPGNRNIDFGGKAITVRSENGAAECTIDCNGTYTDIRRGFHFRNGEEESSIVDGFTVINAAGDWISPAFLCEDSSPAIRNCRIMNNPGGGIFCDGQSSPLISDCLLMGNRAGGVICRGENSPEIRNCLIGSNESFVQHMGIYCQSSKAMIINCTIVGNRYSSGIECDHGAHAVIKNCIIRGNRITLDGATADVTYSNVQGGWPGVGNTSGDPGFVLPGHWEDRANTPEWWWDDIWVVGEYHLKSQAGRWDANEGRWTMDEVTSPCVDAGDPMSPIGLEPFGNGGRVNMGAFGGTAEASKTYFGKPPCETALASDINGDCAVDFEDLRLMALHWCENNDP
ncbi:MAG: right-handed parallel beta-helix repeat-containing protein [Planctomycetota bacterium]|jgi:pectin methylesterase-like acyl-CoA thioesterase